MRTFFFFYFHFNLTNLIRNFTKKYCWSFKERASKMALVVKNPPVSAGDTGDVG